MGNFLKEREVGLDDFAKDVLNGLSSSPKKIYSKYLYDDKGSKLFEEIMNLPEYYPTKCEFEILEKHKSQILEFCSEGEALEMIDLGAGNGLKAMVLINYFLRRIKLKYVPVDISKVTVDELENTLSKKYPSLETSGLHIEYTEAFKKISLNNELKKMVLLLGSNIGNFTFKEAIYFLKKLRASLNKNDLLFIGFDLKKDPAVIRRAYDDSKGVTAAFNLNILKRINTELGSRFDLQKFSYYPSYDPSLGEMKSYLISLEPQEIFVEKLTKSFTFKKWETIHTECSNKFDLMLIEKLASRSGFSMLANFQDSRKYFVDSLWKAE